MPRRHLEGSILGEGVILLAFLAPLLLLLVYQATKYHQLLFRQREVRLATWVPTLRGCSSGPADATLNSFFFNYSGKSNQHVPLRTPYFDKVIRQRIDVEQNTNLTPPAILNMPQVLVPYRIRTGCNEVVQPTDTDLRPAILDAFCRKAGC